MHHIPLRIFILAASAVAAFTAAPVGATRWVASGDPYVWIDLDSIQVREGITYFATGHMSYDGRPPTGASNMLDHAINCATNEHYYQRMVNAEAFNRGIAESISRSTTNSVTPQYQWAQFPQNSEAAEYFDANRRIVCNR